MENFMYLAYAVAGIIRYWLLNSDYKQTIGDRVEISTPLNSWRKGNVYVIVCTYFLVDSTPTPSIFFKFEI